VAVPKGQLVEDGPQAAGAEAHGARGGQHLLGVDRLVADVGGHHVGEPHDRGVGVRLIGVVALDRAREPDRQLPAAGQHPAHEGVVDAEVQTFGPDALLGGVRVAVDPLGVARVGLDQHELADVVQQRGHEHAIAVGMVDLASDAVGGSLDGDRV
jgi:hypothetical protein